MAIDGIGNIKSTGSLDPSLTAAPARDTKSEAIGAEEFLQLLVTQLKHQDPLDPMKNEDFAVNLAQFNQLEQLIGINDKLKGQQGGDVSSLAAYLGTEVLLGDSVKVEDGNGGDVAFSLGSNTINGTLEFLKPDGTVVGQANLGALSAGNQTVALRNLNLPDGKYNVRLTANGTDGRTHTPAVSAAGIVSGFIPGPDPVLLVNGQEISPADIKEVRQAPVGSVDEPAAPEEEDEE